MKPAAIILTAGESRRMGSPKALLPFRDGTFLSVLARTMGTYCDPVIAVFGHDAARLMALAPPDVRPVGNPQYLKGMLTSLQTGLASLDADTILFTLVDHPAVQPSTVEALLRSKAPIAIPRCDGKRGHPVLIRRSIAAEFLLEPETAQVRDVINRHADIEYIEVQDPGIRDDIDDPQLYQELLKREAVRS